MIIDITNEIYTRIKNDLSTVQVLSSYPSTIPSFPCVILDEISNTIRVETIDSAGQNHCQITLQLDIFSNSQAKISEVKGIRNSIDNVLSGEYKMTRIFAGSTPNFMDTNIYRYTLRYTFTIDENKVIYRG